MISPDARVLSFRGVHPMLHDSVFLAPGATVIGDVIVEEGSSIWYHTLVRGDVNFVRVGRNSNLQDGCVIHVTTDTHPVRIGEEVVVGHGAVIHGATLEDACLVGIGARVLDGARVGAGAMVGAGSLVPPGMEVPPRTLVVGTPARVSRVLTPEEVERTRQNAEQYRDLARRHARELGLLPADR